MTYKSKAQKALEDENAALKRRLEYWKSRAEELDYENTKLVEKLLRFIRDLPPGSLLLDRDTRESGHEPTGLAE